MYSNTTRVRLRRNALYIASPIVDDITRENNVSFVLSRKKYSIAKSIISIFPRKIGTIGIDDIKLPRRQPGVPWSILHNTRHPQDFHELKSVHFYFETVPEPLFSPAPLDA